MIGTMDTESETASFSGRILKESVSLMYRCYLRVWGYAAKPRDHMLNQLHEKAWVATQHRYVQTYRGVLLFADGQGVTAMIDSRTWQYIEASPDKLLFLPTIEEAKLFIDTRVQAYSFLHCDGHDEKQQEAPQVKKACSRLLIQPLLEAHHIKHGNPPTAQFHYIRPLELVKNPGNRLSLRSDHILEFLMVDQRSFTILLNRGSTRATRAGTLRIADVPLMAGTPGEQDQESHGTRRDMDWILLTGPTCR